MRAIELHLLLWLTAVTLSSEDEGLLTATVTLRDQRDPVYVGEDVTLICSIEGGYTGWKYHWEKDHQTGWIKSNEHTVTISSVTASDGGQYRCIAYRDDLHAVVYVSTVSNYFTLSVHDLLKATLRLKNPRDPVFVGEDVTLICSIEGKHTGWTYHWYKDNQTGWRRSHENTISPVTVANSGQYQCEAYRDDRPSVPVSTISNAVTLRVQERQATLTITSNRTGKQIFEGDEVKMMCKVDGNPVNWKYELYKTGDTYPYKEQMKKTFTISRVTPSDSGEYKCRAVKDDLLSRFSEPVQLQVSVVTTVTTVTTSKSNSVLDTFTIIIIVSLVLALLIFLLGLLLWVYHKKKGLPCLVSKKSSVCVVFLRVLRFPPTVQRHAE
ncbi:basement membrane-specific heparan sulfate proteoglycan core protein-like isoform X2 [Polypterus senegalus]|uniref:basement membrane-specific heparan sulfate proteoglycan core protein-like isoform X2 n=1 Tax=Polypterus senegalus TaxID=55291 RepID=UPI0019668AE6|nr:basement membrane-specific heparan sulfate proteoglycan core protein-like isoform X2 [Polypterus senegalus]